MTIPAEEGYYNQFDPSKRYVEVRARAGYPPQSQEFNELQSIVRHVHQSLTDTLFKEGSIVKAESGTFSQSVDGGTLSMRNVSFYAEGLIHDVPAASLVLPAAGFAYVGVRLTELLVTSETDAALLDPAVEELNYGQPGANRKQVTAAWELRTSNLPSAGFYSVYTFLDRQQQLAVAVGQVDPVMQTLARRTYDESGNYVVNGFDLSVESALEASSKNFRLKVSNRNDINLAGSTAYVQGNQIIKLVPNYLDVEKALNTATFVDTYHRYTVRSDYNATNHRFLLFKQPASKINAVYAFFDKVVTVSGHNLNGFDEIPLSPGESLAEILQVFTAGDTSPGSIESPEKVYLDAGSNVGFGAFYLQGTRLYWNPIPDSFKDPWDTTQSYAPGQIVKYLQREGDDRYWRAKVNVTPGNPPVTDLAGTIDSARWQEVYINEPPANETYHVYLRYQRALQPAEFALYTDAGGACYLDLSYFIPPEIQKPFVRNLANGSYPGSDLRIEYSYYLSRVDVVYLDGEGELRIAKGESSETPVAPPILPDVLALGSLTIGAGKGHEGTTLKTYNVKRLTMLELRELIERLNRTEYNTAVNNLNSQGLQRAGTTAALRGVLTESFVYTTDNLAKGELRYDAVSSTKKSLNFLGQSFGLETDSHTSFNNTPYKLVLTQTAEKLKLTGGSLLTLTRQTPDIEREALQQTKVTGAIRVNQFDEFRPDPVLGLMSPSGGTEEVPDLITTDTVNFRNLIHNYEFDWQAYTRDREAYSTKFAATELPKTGVPMVMSPHRNVATGTGFPAFAIIELRVDGRRPYLAKPTEEEGSLRGWICRGDGVRLPDDELPQTISLFNGKAVQAYANSCLVQADASGSFKVAFFIPEGIPSGVVAVDAQVLFNDRRIGAQAPYTAQGFTKVVNNTSGLAQLVRLIENPKNQAAPQFIAINPIKFYKVGVGGALTLIEDENLPLNANEKVQIHVTFQLPSASGAAGTAARVGIPDKVQVAITQSTTDSAANVGIPAGAQTYNHLGSYVLWSGETTEPTLKYKVEWKAVEANATERTIVISTPESTDEGLNSINKPFNVSIALLNRDAATVGNAKLKINNVAVENAVAVVAGPDSAVQGNSTGGAEFEITAENATRVNATIQGQPNATVVFS